MLLESTKLTHKQGKKKRKIVELYISLQNQEYRVVFTQGLEGSVLRGMELYKGSDTIKAYAIFNKQRNHYRDKGWEELMTTKVPSPYHPIITSKAKVTKAKRKKPTERVERNITFEL